MGYQIKLTVSRVAWFPSLLDDVLDTVSKQGLTEKQAQDLAASSQACRSILEDLQKLIDKYGDLATEAPNLTTKIRKVSIFLTSPPGKR